METFCIVFVYVLYAYRTFKLTHVDETENTLINNNNNRITEFDIAMRIIKLSQQ